MRYAKGDPPLNAWCTQGDHRDLPERRMHTDLPNRRDEARPSRTRHIHRSMALHHKRAA